MFQVGPAKLTVSDQWTLIPPEVAKRHQRATRAIPGFQPGWLMDKVHNFISFDFFSFRFVSFYFISPS